MTVRLVRVAAGFCVTSQRASLQQRPLSLQGVELFSHLTVVQCQPGMTPCPFSSRECHGVNRGFSSPVSGSKKPACAATRGLSINTLGS